MKGKPMPFNLHTDPNHPLSANKTNFVWEGKYDKYDNLRNVYLVLRFANEP